MKDAKNEENTGKDALNKAAQFLIGRNLDMLATLFQNT